jgi:hypothetical protein
MEAILIALVITAPVIALGTAVYLWGRRHSTPDRMRYRILQVALPVVAVAAVAWGVLMFQEPRNAEARSSRIRMGLVGFGATAIYLTLELRRTRNRLE